MGQHDKLWSQEGSFFPIESQKKGTVTELCWCLQGGQRGRNIKVLLWNMGCSHEPWPLIITKFPGSSLSNTCTEASECESLWQMLQYKRWSSGRCKERIRPKQEIGTYMLKDGYNKWCKKAFIKARGNVFYFHNIWRVEYWKRILALFIKKQLRDFVPTYLQNKYWGWDPIRCPRW